MRFLDRFETLSWVFSLLPLLALSANAKEISGQIFVVTKAHETVKLALVPVEVYRKEDVESTMAAVDAELKHDRERSENFIRVLEQGYKVAEAASNQLSATADTLPRANAAAAASALVSAILHLETRAFARRDFLNGAGAYFSKLRQNYRPIGITKSDADGKFATQIPDDGDFALIASSRREVGDSLELYFWAVPALAHTDLTNDNLVTDAAGSSLLHVKRDGARADASITEDQLRAEFDKIKADHADVLQAIARIGSPQSSPAIASSPSPQPRTAVLARPVVIQAQQGSITLPAGTAVELVSQDAANARIRYSGRDLIVPAYVIANP